MLRPALRPLLKHPGFTIVAVLTLALGIGATTAITSVLRTALFDPLPMTHPERYVSLYAQDAKAGWSANGLNPIAAREAEVATNVFRTVALSELDQLTLDGGDYPQPLSTFRVTEGFFLLVGARPQLGRLPAPEEFRTGSAPGIVLGHQVWQTVFGGDPGVVGRTLKFREGPFTVLGVMPPAFRFPTASGDAWIPWTGPKWKSGAAFPSDSSASLPNTLVQAELQPGVTRAQAQAWLNVLQSQQASADDFQKQFRFIASDLADRFTKPELRRTLWALLVMTVILLLIASTNLASLQLTRTESRQQELAVRAALGAGRWRIVRQLLLESLLLAFLGGLAGLAVTSLGLELLVKLLPPELPRLRAVPLDGRVLSWTILVTLGTGVLFGLAPAWWGGRLSVHDALKLGGTRLSANRHGLQFTGALVVIQVALALVLLTGTGLMARSVFKLLHVDVGFDPHNLIRMYPPIDLGVVNRILGSPGGGDAAEKYLNGIYDNLQHRLSALPGVEGVSMAQPTQGAVSVSLQPDGASVDLSVYRISLKAADPLRILRARLLLGRWLDRDDGIPSQERVLINESAARRLWPGEAAVGRRLWLQLPDEVQPVEVAGVISDLRENAYNESPRPTVFRATPFSLFSSSPALVIRTSVPYRTLQSSFERELKAAGASFERPLLFSAEESLYWSTAAHRTFLNYLAVFAAVGLLLCALGLYGVLSFNVARRTQEIGIRMALGAGRAAVVGLIVRQGMRLAFIGVAVGLAGAIACTRGLQSFLFGVGPLDLTTFAAVSLLLASVAALACWLPARRAARVEPILALRGE